MLLIAPSSGRIVSGSRPAVVVSGVHVGMLTHLCSANAMPMPEWATITRDEEVGDGGERLVAVSYPERFSVGLFDPRLCPPPRSVSYEEQQAARDAAWEERRRVVAHAGLCANILRPHHPDIADALEAFGKEIADEEHLR